MSHYRLLAILTILMNIITFAYSVEVKIHNFSGYPGQTQIAKITIDDIGIFIAGIIAIDIELTYDPNILLVRNATKGDILPSEWIFMTNTQSPGKVMIQMMSWLKEGEFIELNEVGEIVKISFQISNNAKPGQTSSLILSKVYINENADIVRKINGICNILGDQQNKTFTLRLQTGWNLISLPINIENTNIDAFLNKISGKYESIWSWDRENEWKKSIYNAPAWLNDLKVIQPGRGYWIKMFSQATIDIYGQELSDHNIQLYKGWNLVGFNNLTQMAVNNALSSISGYYNSIWGYDPQLSDWKKLIIGAPNQINNLSVLKPGEGYWIEARNNVVWNVNANFAQSPKEFADHYAKDNNMPIIPCLIYGEINVAGFEFVKPNDEFYVELRYNDSLLIKNRIKKSNGNYYALYCPESFFGKLLDISVLLNKKLIYSNKIVCGYSGDLIRFDFNHTSLPKRNFLYQNYPNPFNPETWIPYEVKETSEVQIKIFDINYKVVRTLSLGYKFPGFYITKENSAYWDGKNDAGEPVVSGLYFCNIRIGNYSSIIKMVLSR